MAGIKEAENQIALSKVRTAISYKKGVLAIREIGKLTRVSISIKNGYRGNIVWKVRAFGKIFRNYDLISALLEVSKMAIKLNS